MQETVSHKGLDSLFWDDLLPPDRERVCTSHLGFQACLDFLVVMRDIGTQLSWITLTIQLELGQTTHFATCARFRLSICKLRDDMMLFKITAMC